MKVQKFARGHSGDGQTEKNRGECNMFENLIATLKADKRKIVFTEGPEPRIL